MQKLIHKALILFSFLFIFSCGGQKSEELVSEEEYSKPELQESKFNAQNVFNTLPERKLVMKLIDENRIEYNPDLLNDPTLSNKYIVELAKAANLGIYGADLSIASSFDQTQESMVFLKCVNILAGYLGVNSAFDQRMFERIDANDNNKDSVIEIVTGAFKKVDEILKSNKRPATSAIILSGCWIEGLYVSCQLAQENGTESIIKAIVKQKESLRNLIVMMEGVTLEENAKFILSDLQELYKIYNVAETTTTYDKRAIEGITKKISELRNKMTNASEEVTTPSNGLSKSF
ncbi:hypothetical protein [Aurantibacillus circumpalustris]|uniref:hypothetical protein n=1 Tax=Aurantibacillus circumpalustris TaxID=3036359 RepID=UPI00295A7F00|nr:hypothetical protein [Aurantibacillus circumpalustris]